jgi:hypothetical protein
VYFSDATRNFYTKDFLASYRGVLLLLLQNHIQFRIVTPRTLGSFGGRVLVLPDVRMVSGAEAQAFHQFDHQGGSLVMTGHPDAKLSDLSQAHLYPDSPERAYLSSADADFERADATIAAELMNNLRVSSGVDVAASRNVVAHVATIGTRDYIFLANFDGLKAGEVATPRIQKGIDIRVTGHFGSRLHFLPFLGKESLIASQPDAKGVRFTLPALDRGAVAWID